MSPPKRPLRFVGYARVSTDEQADDRNSLPAQQEALEIWARQRGHTLVDVAVDAGLSGKITLEGRPALAAALRRVRTKDVDGLLFWKLDRVSRVAHELLALAREARDTGWHLACVYDPLDTTTPIGQFVILIMAGLAELESGNISSRTTLGMRHARKTGRCVSRYTPFGYRIDAPEGPWENPGGKGARLLVPCPAEQALLAHIVGARDAGESAYKVAQALNRAGLRNPRGGRKWISATVGHIYDRVARERAREEAAS